MPGKFEAPRNRSGAQRPNDQPQRGQTRQPAPQEQPQRPRQPVADCQPPQTQQPNRTRRPRRRTRRLNPLFFAGIGLLVLTMVLVLTMCGKKEPKPDKNPELPTTAATQQTDPLPTEPEVVAKATVISQGDLLMHSYLFTSNPKYPSAAYSGEENYNFDSIFRYIQPYVSAADYGVANLETTFGGSGKPYSGNPLFNCPDALADSVAKAGFDMLLTANNHCHDTGTDGLKRTLEQVRARNLATLGTQLNDTEKKYTVVDINGIQIGMVCYTYAGGLEADGSPNLNLSEATVVREKGIVNFFTEGKLDAFYTQIQTQLEAMRAEGAEATMVYIHWGQEYQTTENATQRTMAQKLCDMGVDVIVGGHPHVVQPMDLLTSTTDLTHKTVCIYSLGNAVSNQRKEELKKSCPTGHSEDGVLFSVTFGKNSEGVVSVADVQVIPTWVNKFTNGDGKVEYNILPLEDSQRQQWKNQFSLTDSQFTACQDSYQRTMAILSPGLEKCRTQLGSSSGITAAEAA